MNDRFVDWYLVRHAPVAGAREGIYRSLDGEADLSNVESIQFAAALLPAEGLWWSSPMRRTRETARSLRETMRLEGATMEIDERLREQSFGEWHGLTFEELWSRIETLPPHNWSYLAPSTVPPGGESYRELWDRVTGFVAERSRDERPEPRVLVTHAGVIRAVVGQALGTSPSRALAMALSTLSVTKLTQRLAPGDDASVDRGGNWQLQYLNRALLP